MWADLSGRLQALWSSQNRTNRILGLSALGVVVIAIGAFLYFDIFRKPDYGVLFSNLSAEDAATITTKLADDKVPYQLTDGGTTVKVPMDRLYQERVDIAGAGLLKEGGTGYELFDRTNLGMTDFQEKIARLRATEGELQRTIDALTPVQASRVHIAQPDATLYSSVQAPTTASIAITTKPGQSLSASEVHGISMLVANAVDNLKPENITIVNQEGNILNGSGQTQTDAAVAAQASALRLTQDQLVAKQRYETNLQQNIQSMLDATLGPKRSAVRVATDMDFDANKSDTTSYAPQGTVRSEQTERESYTGTAARPAAIGAPGTATNIVGTYQGFQQNQNNGRYNRSKSTRNYEITEQKVSHIDAPGKVLRTSVAVLVNVPAVAAPAANPNAAQAATLPAYAVAPADVTKIRNVVAAAAGIDPARGDQVSVEAIPFNPAVTGEVAGRGGTSTIFGLPAAGLIALAAIALLIGAGAGYALYRRRQPAAFRPGEDLPSFDSTLAEELPPFDEHPILDGAQALAAPIRSAADLTREQMMEYVTTVAQENPDSIAKLIKLWLAE